MTDTEKILTVQTLVDDEAATDALVGVYLSDASAEILLRLYPFGVPAGSTVPVQYHYHQCRLAARYWLRKGAEGEVTHNENGVNRTYGSANDEDILREIMPYARVF